MEDNINQITKAMNTSNKEDKKKKDKKKDRRYWQNEAWTVHCMQNAIILYEKKKAILKNNLPTWADDTGTVILIFGKTTIDSFKYSKTLHNPLFTDLNGVSLERVAYEKPSQFSSNWQSAAATVGFASPAFEN